MNYSGSVAWMTDAVEAKNERRLHFVFLECWDSLLTSGFVNGSCSDQRNQTSHSPLGLGPQGPETGSEETVGTRTPVPRQRGPVRTT